MQDWKSTADSLNQMQKLLFTASLQSAGEVARTVLLLRALYEVVVARRHYTLTFSLIGYHLVLLNIFTYRILLLRPCYSTSNTPTTYLRLNKKYKPLLAKNKLLLQLSCALTLLIKHLLPLLHPLSLTCVWAEHAGAVSWSLTGLTLIVGHRHSAGIGVIYIIYNIYYIFYILKKYTVCHPTMPSYYSSPFCSFCWVRTLMTFLRRCRFTYLFFRLLYPICIQTVYLTFKGEDC